MKEIMEEIRMRFEKALKNNGDIKLSSKETIEIYDRIASEVYLEKLSLFMERGN